MTSIVRHPRALALIVCVCVIVPDATFDAFAQDSKQDAYTWFGELVSYDQAVNVLTVKARVREHVNKYTGRFSRGDRLVLIWATPRPGETEAITYIERYTDSAVLKSGYVLPVEFVSADPTASQLTFSLTPPPDAAATLRAVRPGAWIKVRTPFDQPTEIAAIQSIEPSSVPHTPTSSAPGASKEELRSQP
jgi:hypothetical protein